MKTLSSCILVLLVGCSGSHEAARCPDAGVEPDAGLAPVLHPRWVSAGRQSTIAHRYGQSATLLADGRVLAAGGGTREPSPGANEVRGGAETFDPATRVWTPTGSLQVARGAHRATVLRDGRVLVTGGERVPMSQWTALASAEIYDPSTATWRLTAPMKRSRLNHAQVLLADGRVLVAGGTRGADRFPVDEYLAAVEVFDPATETWTSWAPLSQVEPRADALLLGDGRVLITGLFHAELYDPSIGSQPPPLPQEPSYTSPPPYTPQQAVDCGVPGIGAEHATALANGTAHILSVRMSFVLDPTQPTLCRSLLGPHTAMTGGKASVELPGGHILFTFGIREAVLLDPATGAVTAVSPRIYPRGKSHLLLLGDGSALVTGGDDVPSELLEWR